MSIYIEIIRKSFKCFSIYRVNAVMNLLSGFIMIFLQVSLWNALYDNEFFHSATLADVITYTLLNTLLLKRCLLYVSEIISNSIYSNEIEIDLIRPISLKTMSLMQSIGRNLFNLCTFSFPIILVTIIIFEVRKPSNIESLLGAIITAVLGQIIFWLLECILGYTAFWLKTNWYLAYIEMAVMTLFGGIVIPIWFYPDWLKNICLFLPFRYMIYEPIYIYLYSRSSYEVMKVIMIQVVWIFFFLIVEKKVWHRAVIRAGY